MKSKKKVFLTVLCAAALVVASVLGTMAFLTSTDTVTNTFTVGNVNITLDEAPVNVNGDAISGDRVDANSYKLIPGKTYDKDPIVHVTNGSENCYVFVKIDNQISNLEATGDTTIAAQMAVKGWKQLNNTNVYYQENPVAANSNITVFEHFTLSDDANVSNYTGKQIIVNAYAIQAEGFDDAAAAWAAAPAEWK